MPDKDRDKDHVQNLLVAVRVRPMNTSEIETECSEIAHVLDDNLVVLQDPNEDQDDILRANRSREKQYVFDIAFGSNATQGDVYAQTSKVLVEKVTSGYNATVFAYGATGAGKTYTMLGTDRMPGIMGLALNDLFTEMDRTKDEMTYKVSMSYLEIYNEMIRDLLNPSSGYLELREDAKGVVVAGISEVEAKTTTELMSMLMMGNKQRTCEPTAANKTSSRSHAVLQVTVKQKSRVKNVMQEIKIGKLFMIDLAGSERAAQTKNRGKRMIEGAHINRSLLALGNCINALCENRGQYVNFRDSKLTRLLKDSLGGNSSTVMIAHVSPASQAFEESRNTLLYADRAKNIKNKVRCNQFNVSYHIAQYTNIIADLRKEIFRLKMKIEEHEMEESKKGSNQTTENQEEMVKLRNQLVGTFREQMDIRRKLMALENETIQITVDTNRYMMVIDEWEQEKARRVARNRQSTKEKQRRRSDATADSDKKSSDRQDESHSGREKKGSPRDRTEDAHNRKTSAKYVKELMNKEEKEREEMALGQVENLAKSESLEDVESKDLDTEKELKLTKRSNENERRETLVDNVESESLLEPDEVAFARDEISSLIAEVKRTSELKTDLQSKLMQTRKEVEHLEELLPRKISTEEHREILGLLCRVHELEITNAEFQSQALLSDNFLRQKDFTISKYESKLRLCDEIIQMQRALIHEHDIETPLELEALYEMYSQQAFEPEDQASALISSDEGAESALNRSAADLQKVSVLASLNRKVEMPRDNGYSFNKLSPLSEESPSRMMSLQNSPVKTTRPTPSSQSLFPSNQHFTESLPLGLPSPKRKTRDSTPDEISLNSAVPTPILAAKNDRKIVAESTHQDTPDLPIFSKTKKIAEIAAKRRIFMDKSVNSSRSSLRAETESHLSEQGIGSNSDTNLAPANQKGFNDRSTFKSSLSLSDLSMFERKGGYASSEESVAVGRKKIPSKSNVVVVNKKHINSGKNVAKSRLRSASLGDSRMLKVKPRMTRKEELQEAARQNRIAHSQTFSKPRDRGGLGSYGRISFGTSRKRTSLVKLQSVQTTDLPRGREKALLKSKQADQADTRHAQADQLDIKHAQNSRRVPLGDQSEDTSELIHFFSNATPPSTVQQHGVPFGKGHTIQKRYRGPLDSVGTDSSNSTPRLKPRKNVTSVPPRSGGSKDELSVSGHAVKPSRHYAGTRRS